MIFGDKNHFAVEVIIDLPANFPAFGYIRFWIQNTSVGDIEKITIINSLSYHVKDFVGRRGERVKDDLFSLPSEVFWVTIGNMYWGVAPDSGLIIEANPYAFILCPTGTESFDDVRVLVVENSFGKQKVLFGTFSELVDTVVFSDNLLESVIKDFLEWIAPLAEREKSYSFQEQYGRPHDYSES